MSHSTDVDLAIDGEETDSNMQSMTLLGNQQNEFSLSLSRTLVRQLENMAKYEGISSIDLMVELVAEGLARRMAEDQSRPAPSHLMTRNGYVQDHAHTQPTMSHHSFQQNVGNAHTQNRHQSHYQRNAASRQQNRYQNRSRSGYFKSSKKSEG